MFRKLPLTINGGFQTRDFVYINDVVDVMIKLMNKIQKQKIYKIFNLGTGRSVKIDLLFNLIKKKFKTNPKVFRKKLKKFDAKKSSGTFKKINKFLNLKKNYFTKLNEGLDETIDYMKKVH